MRTHRMTAIGVGLALAVAGCAPRAGMRTAPLRAERQATPYSLGLEFTSDVPDPYRVLAGPIETDQRLAVNLESRAALERLVRAKSGEGEAVTLRVRLLTFDTGYRRLGSVGPSGHLPEEARKAASLRAQAELERGGKSLGQQVLQAEAVAVWRWDDTGEARSPYGFRDVLALAVDRLSDQVDAFVDRTLGAGR